MSLDPMQTPGNLNWDAASVDLPEIPMLPPGEDAMSMTISAVLPTLTTPMAASVAALQAKETMFSGKLGAAESAYQNADDSGGQSVGQLGQMLGQLGQVGQMAQQAGAPAQALGGQAGQFGSMMQQAMQSAKGGESAGTGGQASAGQAPAGHGPAGAGAAPPRDDRDDRDERENPTDRDRRPPLDAAAPGPTNHEAGSVPVAPPRQGDGDDLSRRM
ncbi:hypothetical protein TUM20985_06880 [Mycobacterium antarcticum]|uniref:hypothetical protein n=1 Tax=unclassified Mycolicibacterium TaxID=2636767 RepID=UPI00239DF7F7|nr:MULTISPECIES: hypothetical protein [unclassified Mycolicibacterium]BDX30141.1 hypothetical protein TUM20985_06880 [Mycolicibacterium sp. TUM20985]GLP73561.1 hypothetical protein TUM20983_06710 [Mycolicibacterium sp. TUM20983]GLP79277.1 hypothetical protein TUM20984_06970 [Mycolicibacterium sp. TUM20984]